LSKIINHIDPPESSENLARTQAYINELKQLVAKNPGAESVQLSNGDSIYFPDQEILKLETQLQKQNEYNDKVFPQLAKINRIIQERKTKLLAELKEEASKLKQKIEQRQMLTPEELGKVVNNSEIIFGKKLFPFFKSVLEILKSETPPKPEKILELWRKINNTQTFMQIKPALDLLSEQEAYQKAPNKESYKYTTYGINGEPIGESAGRAKIDERKIQEVLREVSQAVLLSQLLENQYPLDQKPSIRQNFSLKNINGEQVPVRSS